VKLRQILPTTSNMSPVIVHSDCARALYNAFLRQIQWMRPQQISNYCDGYVIAYHDFCDQLFINEIEPLLRDFTYNVEAWINHLKDFKHQLEVIPFYQKYQQGILEEPEWFDNTYTLICKLEKQACDVIDNKVVIPKTRAISACPHNVKWIMGPIILRLEEIIGKNFKGYKFNYQGQQLKTWQEIEEYYDHCFNVKQLTVSQDIDGSRWDTTQYVHMKYLTFKIYDYLAENNLIYHVTPKLFQHISTQRYRKLVAKLFTDKKTLVIGRANIDSTTFSGSPDTTFMNTLTNASVGRFIFEDPLNLNIQPEDYEIFTSGDDYGSFTTPEIAQKFTKVAKNVWDALALVPKYIHNGSYTDISFCSTNVIQYYEDGIFKHKIVRQVNRMNPLSHYSVKAINYTQAEMKFYYQQLATGVRNWALDMPFYSDYANAFQHYSDIIKLPPTEPKEGRKKITLPTNWHIKYDINDFEFNKYNFRKSHRQPPPQVVYDFLLEKFGWNQQEVDLYKTKLIQPTNYLPS